MSDESKETSNESAETEANETAATAEAANVKETTNDAPKKKKKSAGASTAHDSPMAKRGSDYRIPSTSRWAGMWKRAALAGGVGAIGAIIGMLKDPTRFAFSYLFAFCVVMTITLGSFFFIIIERLTSAGWSVSTRRTAEFFASSAWVLAILFIPIAANLKILYPWWTGNATVQLAPPPADAKSNPDSTTSALDALALEKDALAQTSSQPPPGQGAPPPGMGQGRPQMMGGGMGGPPGGMGGPPGMRMTHGGPGGMGGPGMGGPGMGGPGMGGAHHMGGPGMGGQEAQHANTHGDPEHIEEQETLQKKSLFLNRTFFAARIPVYLLIWIFLGWRFFGFSTDQDTSKDPELTKRAQAFAPKAVILFALSLTFAAFDWLMSLEPTWFSTIFGVQIFAGSVVSIFAVVILVAMSFKEEGLTKNAITTEHFHDLGKLLFGFLVFWAYISFSQFMLIWYAALPEETPFYHLRWDVGPWASVSLLLVLAHFVIPFFMLLSRNVKRRLPALRFGAAWLILMHVVEMYWLVMPNYNAGMLRTQNIWIDVACLMAVVGIYLAVVYQRMTRFPLIAVGDPRLQRSLAFENA